MEDLDPIIQLALALIGTSGGMAAIVNLLRLWARKRRSKHMDAGFADMNEIYQTLQNLLGEIAADRILVIKSENGGGLPRPGCTIKSSVIHEVFNGDLGSLYESWQRVTLDHEYSHVLHILSTGEWVWRATDELARPSVLADLLEPEVKRIAFARICGTNNALWYIALHFRTEGRVDDDDRARTQRAIHKLRILFGNHQTLVKTESKV